MTLEEIKQGNVFRDAGGDKIVITEYNLEIVKANFDNYTFVCEKPHADNDFSYVCWKDWCRCMQ